MLQLLYSTDSAFATGRAVCSNAPSMERDVDELDSTSHERRVPMREICELTGLKRLPLDYYLHPPSIHPSNSPRL
jgi:hypothetical protein